MQEGAAGQASALRIGRLNVICRVPPNHPSPSLLKAQMEKVARQQFPAAADRMLSPIFADPDPSIWFVRRLDVKVDLDEDIKSDQFTRTWAANLTRTLTRTLSRGEDGEEVIRFASRSAYLAQFLRDLADGAAWSKWYYSSLQGLRALSLNAALREAICCEPGVAEAALAELASQRQLDKLLRALNETDCRKVLMSFWGDLRDDGLATGNGELLQTVWRARQRIHPLEGENRASLQLYIELRQGDDGPASSRALMEAICSLILLERWMATRKASKLIQALRSDDKAIAFSIVGEEHMDTMTALLRSDRRIVLKIAEQLQQPKQAGACSEVTGSTSSLFTPFGGAFYLLPRLGELNLEACAGVLPEFGGQPAIALVRFLILLKCLGRVRAPRAFFDPVLRQVSGVAPDLAAAEVRAWARGVGSARTHAFQTGWARCSRESEAISKRYLFVHSAKGGRLLILADGARNIWLCTALSTQELVRLLEEGTADHALGFELCGFEGLISDSTLAALLPSSIGGVPVRSKESPAVAAWAGEDNDLANFLQRARPPDVDLTWMNLGSLLRGARHLDLTLSLAAHGLLRAFAWRLPSFAWSGAEYLCANFLDVSATLRSGEEGFEAQLFKAPLQIVLTMTGAEKGSCLLPWMANEPLRYGPGAERQD